MRLMMQEMNFCKFRPGLMFHHTSCFLVFVPGVVADLRCRKQSCSEAGNRKALGKQTVDTGSKDIDNESENQQKKMPSLVTPALAGQTLEGVASGPEQKNHGGDSAHGG
eukprot:4271452-Amphidinium_carterae.1